MGAKVIVISLALVPPEEMSSHVLLDIMSLGHMIVVVLEWFDALRRLCRMHYFLTIRRTSKTYLSEALHISTSLLDTLLQATSTLLPWMPSLQICSQLSRI